MDSTFNKVYLYDNIRQLLAIGDTFCNCRDNGPMNNRTMKIHKGVDNKLYFRVLGPDRVPIDVSCNQQVYARLIDPDNRKVVLETLCTLGPAKGLVTVSIDSGDIAFLHAGLYNMVLIRTQDFISNVPDYYIERPLFSDYDDNIVLKVEVTEQAFKAPLPSYTILEKDWTPDMMIPVMGPPIKCFYTERIPAGRVQNHIDSVHSFSVYTEKAIGTLEIFGTLEETPDPYLNPTRWFKIYPSSMSNDIEYRNYTGTQAWTFSANFLWLKFRWIPSQQVLDPGKLKKLIVRT
jgi:hypothetical protein